MHKIFTLSLLYYLLVLPAVSQGQSNLPAHKINQNKNWIFGKNKGLSFNSGSPVVISSKTKQWYGISSTSDVSGQLIIYADRDTIRDRNGNPMPNGAGGLINGLPNLTQIGSTGEMASRIVPCIGNKNRYYVFSQTSYWYSPNAYYYGGNDPAAGRLYYSVVDMALNGGLGDVLPNQKGILLDTMLLDRSVVVKGSNCNFWILTMTQDASTIHAFEITENGINTTPVVSTISPILGPGAYATARKMLGGGMTYFGQMIASPDNSKLAVTLSGLVPDTSASYYYYGGGFELFDFDNATGIVSNQINVTKSRFLTVVLRDFVSDICFSPDNTKLYTAQSFLYGTGLLYQYDITGGNAAAIFASRVTLDSGRVGWGNGMRLGPDDKIYISGWRASVSAPGTTLHRIEYPNISGTAATLTLNAITLPTGDSCYLGLGNPTIDLPAITDSITTPHPLFLCAENPSLTLTPLLTTGYDYLWDNGQSVSTRTINQPGTYWVTYFSQCIKYTDSFTVLPLNLTPDLGPDREVCGVVDPPIQLQLPIVPGANYLWQDGSVLPDYTITDSGTYYVTVTKSGCMGSDTLKITSYDVFQDLGDDTVVCEKTPFDIELKASAPQGAIVEWNTGETTPDIHATIPGTYVVTVTQSTCSSTDSVSITTEMCDCITFMPNAFSPNGDGLNDLFVPKFEPGCEISGYNLQVFNRYGQMIFSSSRTGEGWDGTHKGIPLTPDTYMFTISYEKGTQHHTYTHKGDVTLIR